MLPSTRSPVVRASVIICTYNRSALLADSIRAVRSQDLPRDEYEIVVVDNNSNDDTKVLVEGMATDSPVRLTYVFEGTQGLSSARNAGIGQAAGDVVVFIDDDIDAETYWLRELLEAFRDPDVACAGGPIRPIWPFARPDWLTDRWQGHFTVSEFKAARARGEFKGPDYPWGANIAFRREVFRTIGMFPTDLGRLGRRLLSNEEINLCRRVEASGKRIAFAAKAVIHHKIDPERVRKLWLYHRTYWQGRSNAVLDISTGKDVYAGIRTRLDRLQRLARDRTTGTVDRSCISREAFGYIHELVEGSQQDGRVGTIRSLRALKHLVNALSAGRGRVPETQTDQASGADTGPGSRRQPDGADEAILPVSRPGDRVLASQAAGKVVVSRTTKSPGAQQAREAELPSCSIVIPVRDAASTLRVCLESIARLNYPAERLEVLIVDNGSSDETVNIARGFNVTVLSETAVKSSYAARNAGIRAARGDAVAFTDADCVVTPDWLRHLLSHYGDQTVGCFAGEIEAYLPEGLVETFSDRAGILRQRWTLECPYLPYPQTANAAYRKSVFDRLGPFIPGMISGGDADIAWRMQKHLGLKIRFIPEALIYHKHRSSLQGLYEQHRKYEFGKYSWSQAYADYQFPSFKDRKREFEQSIHQFAAALHNGIGRLSNGEIDFVDYVSPFLRLLMAAGTFSARLEIDNVKPGDISHRAPAPPEPSPDIEALNAIIAEKDDIISTQGEEIERLLSSRSWRVTAPLRWGRRTLAGRKRS